MKLPAADRAVVDPAKVRDYLLSAEHPVGRSKASSFRALGFTQAEWPGLQQALLRLATTGDAVPGAGNAFGQKYIVRGSLIGPNGRSAEIVTVWIVLAQDAIPRFVTAYRGGG